MKNIFRPTFFLHFFLFAVISDGRLLPAQAQARWQGKLDSRESCALASSSPPRGIIMGSQCEEEGRGGGVANFWQNSSYFRYQIVDFFKPGYHNPARPSTNWRGGSNTKVNW